jgi:hypothetical protein
MWERPRAPEPPARFAFCNATALRGRQPTPVALRGRRQGATAPPAPPAQGFALGNPDPMRSRDECLTHMPTGRDQPATGEQRLYMYGRHVCGQMNAVIDNPALGTTEACAGAVIVRQASVAGGLGTRCAHSGERDVSPLGVEPTRIYGTAF